MPTKPLLRDFRHQLFSQPQHHISSFLPDILSLNPTAKQLILWYNKRTLYVIQDIMEEAHRLGVGLILGLTLLSSGSCWQGCSRTDPKLNECIQQKLVKLLPNFKQVVDATGSDIPLLDPLEVPPFQTSHEDKNISISLEARNVQIAGLASTNISQVKSKTIDGLLKVVVLGRVPELQATGWYVSNGLVSTFPLHSEGSFNITMRGVTLAIMAYLSNVANVSPPPMVDAPPMPTYSYLQVDQLQLDAMPLEIMVSVAREMDGDPHLGKILNVYLNQNSFELYNIVKPGIMKSVGRLITELINAMLVVLPHPMNPADLDNLI